MNKIHKFAAAVAIVGTVGLTYALLMLKGMPDVFDWEDNDEEII